MNNPFEQKFDNLSNIQPENTEFVDMDVDEEDLMTDEDLDSIIKGTFKNEDED